MTNSTSGGKSRKAFGRDLLISIAASAIVSAGASLLNLMTVDVASWVIPGLIAVIFLVVSLRWSTKHIDPWLEKRDDVKWAFVYVLGGPILLTGIAVLLSWVAVIIVEALYE